MSEERGRAAYNNRRLATHGIDTRMLACWSDFLLAQGAHIENDMVRDFGDASAERHATADADVMADLSIFSLLHFSGEDAESFLHGQLSCDVKALQVGTATYGAYCNAKGRMLATLLLWRATDSFYMLLDRSIAAAIQRRLQMYVLRSKVKISDTAAQPVLLGLSGAHAAAALSENGWQISTAPMSLQFNAAGSVISLPGQRLLLATTEAEARRLWSALVERLKAVGSPCWEWLEIVNGIPWISSVTQEQFVPQMANLDHIGGISFKKGCYPGQEIVARTQYLGKGSRKMALARVQSGASAGESLYSSALGDQACGTVLRAAAATDESSDVLAVLHVDALASADVHLGSLQGPQLAFRSLPYAVHHSGT